MCNLVNACMKNSSQPVPNLKVSHIHPVPTFNLKYSAHKAKPLRMYTMVSRLFQNSTCLLFIQDGQFTFEKMKLSIQGPSPTFDIGDLLFEMVAAIQDQVLFVRWLLLRQGLFVQDINFDFSWIYDLLFEMAYFLFEISNFLFKSRLFIRDGNCLFKIGNFCTVRVGK